jgi:hypothetical protein
MTDLADYTFQFQGIVFGLGQPVAVDGDGWDIGTDDVNNQDAFNIFGDSVSFGEDSREPAVWSWTGHTDLARFADDALEAVRQLGKRWLAKDLRKPGVVVPLYYGVGGRTRVVFGRPRTFSNTMDNGIIKGNIPVQFEFKRADTLFYSADVLSIDISVDEQESTGFIMPATFPLTSLTPIGQPGTIVAVGGDEPAPFAAEIRGPVVNPKISTADWEVQLILEIEAGESVFVSTYPWGTRAIRSSGADVSGHFGAQSRLSKARLDPAGETIEFDGIDSSGTASCTIVWRPAYSTI